MNGSWSGAAAFAFEGWTVLMPTAVLAAASTNAPAAAQRAARVRVGDDLTFWCLLLSGVPYGRLPKGRCGSTRPVFAGGMTSCSVPPFGDGKGVPGTGDIEPAAAAA